MLSKMRVHVLQNVSNHKHSFYIISYALSVREKMRKRRGRRHIDSTLMPCEPGDKRNIYIRVSLPQYYSMFKTSRLLLYKYISGRGDLIKSYKVLQDLHASWSRGGIIKCIYSKFNYDLIVPNRNLTLGCQMVTTLLANDHSDAQILFTTGEIILLIQYVHVNIIAGKHSTCSLAVPV